MADLYGGFSPKFNASKDGRVTYIWGCSHGNANGDWKHSFLQFCLVPLLVQKVHTKPFTWRLLRLPSPYMHTQIPVFFADLLDFAHCQYTHLHQNRQVSDGQRHYFKKSTQWRGPAHGRPAAFRLHPVGAWHSKVSRTCSPLSRKPQIVPFSRKCPDGLN